MMEGNTTMRMLLYSLTALLLTTATVSAQDVPQYVLDACEVEQGLVIGSDTPERYAHLPGVYTGTWDKVLDSAVIVTNVRDDDSVEFYYAWNTYDGWNITRPGCSNRTGEIDDDVMEFDGSRATISYTIQDSGELRGAYKTRNGTSRGTFTKLASHPWTGQ